MSSNSNDTNKNIHLGNYEEFFILYMDNELTGEQMKEVEDFLATHPDLRAELDILMSTRLPMEEFSIDKEDLLAENMKISSIDEELLMFIDNELPEDKRKVVELELASNTSYALQHGLLMKTRLDAGEQVPYPNKKELYRHTERVIAFKIWMRVAAAVIVMASAGVIYFTANQSTGVHTETADRSGTKPPPAKIQEKRQAPQPANELRQPDLASLTPAPETTQNKNTGNKKSKAAAIPVKPQPAPQLALHKNDQPVMNDQPTETYTSMANLTGTIQAPKMVSGTLPAIDPAAIAKSQTVNNSIVTSFPAERKTDIDTAPKEDVAKGSVRGFLRKATRLIERKTGIDPTNDDGELLIAAVALKLK